MANRRMFSLDIIDTDKFLEMPASAQALYFHLGMRADDDGFVNAPRSVMRQSGATEDDMKLLIAKRFVLTFESGVIVIKHWKIHNLIQKDRYKETKYIEEKNRLVLDENNAYTELENALDTKCIQDVSVLESEVRLGKDSIGYKEKVKKESDVCIQIVDMFNQICTSFPKVTKLSDGRRKAINARLKTYTLEDFRRMFDQAERSDFLKGKNGRDWSANFDWLIKDSNFAKVLDGNYTTTQHQEEVIQNESSCSVRLW